MAKTQRGGASTPVGAVRVIEATTQAGAFDNVACEMLIVDSLLWVQHRATLRCFVYSQFTARTEGMPRGSGRPPAQPGVEQSRMFKG